MNALLRNKRVTYLMNQFILIMLANERNVLPINVTLIKSDLRVEFLEYCEIHDDKS